MMYTTRTGDKSKSEEHKRLSAQYRMARIAAAPKPKDQRGSAAGAVVLMLLVAFWITGLAVVFNERANAQAVPLDGPKIHAPRNPVLYVEHVHARWHYAELADGSTWMATRCPTDEGDVYRNCWWNAQTMGNGEGRSYLIIKGRQHFAVSGTVIR